MLILSFPLPLSGWRRLKLGGVGLELIGGGGWVLKSLFLSDLYSGWVVAGSPSATNLARGNEALAGFRAARLIHKQLAFLAFPSLFLSHPHHSTVFTIQKVLPFLSLFIFININNHSRFGSTHDQYVRFQQIILTSHKHLNLINTISRNAFHPNHLRRSGIHCLCLRRSD